MAKKLFEKGNGGRPKGVKNKVTRSVREALLEAFVKMQEDPKYNIYAWGKTNPTKFYEISSKLIPTEIQQQIEVGGGVNIYIPDNSRDSENNQK